ncbi:MAG: energy transducer TonB [Rhodopseudomonas palustris]|uniref:Energy transducer TonB n=1 Tax=Rhodopseudomonas palustris TaxID=1076 RepID=A0A933S318_RHOPL|nr:energy transducer TonB [Rhodopseudomonas palustris]
MNACALHAFSERTGATRWLISAAVIVVVHAAAVAAALAYATQTPPAGDAIAAIMVDMAPATAAPQASPLDLAPGPTMQEAQPPQAEPEPEPVHTAAMPPIESTRPQPAPEVPLPPEQDSAAPHEKPEPPVPSPAVSAEPAKREPAKQAPTRPKPVKPQRIAKLHPSDQPPAPRSSAAPRVERWSENAMAAAAGASAAAAMPSYRQRLAAHLQRFKRYPAEARAAGQQGTATLVFTVGRGGQVLGANLARSSGSAALDAETLAMVRRAAPLPPFPPELTQASLRISVPVSFSVR